MIRWITGATLGVALGLTPVSADDAPWGFDTPTALADPVSAPSSLASDLFDGLVSAYREAGDRDSIHRCQFAVSCSHFAERSIHRYGVVGLVVFVDRYFYRENSQTRILYPLAAVADGTFRSDDAFFVP